MRNSNYFIVLDAKLKVLYFAATVDHVLFYHINKMIYFLFDSMNML